MPGVLTRYYGVGGGVDDDEVDYSAAWDDAPVSGALTQGSLTSPDAQKLNALSQMRNNLFAQQEARRAARNGGINLPMLSAAGAFFAPTKSGGLGESISNAIGASVPMALQQRKIDADEEKTFAQQQWNRMYQEELLKDRTRGRDTTEQRRIDQLKIAQDKLDARANEIVAKANAAAGKGTYTSTGQWTSDGHLILSNKDGQTIASNLIGGASPNAQLAATTRQGTTAQNNASRERTTGWNNTSRADIAQVRADMQRELEGNRIASREGIAGQTIASRENMAEANRGSREGIAGQTIASRENMAEANRTSREGTAGQELAFKYTKLDSDAEVKKREQDLVDQGKKRMEARLQARLEFDKQKADRDAQIHTNAQTLIAQGQAATTAYRQARLDWEKERQANDIAAKEQGLGISTGSKERIAELVAQGKTATEARLQARLEFDKQKADLDRSIKEKALEYKKAGMDETAATAKARTLIMQQNADTARVKAMVDKDEVLTDETIDIMARQGNAGDTSVYTNMGRGRQGSSNLVRLRNAQARLLAEEGKGGPDLAAATSAYQGNRAAQRTAGNRAAQMGMANAEAQTFMPLAIAASEKVNRSNYPNINSLWLAAEKGTGDENVVRLAVATQSLLNAYARAITPTGVPTEGAQARGHELLDKAWSQGQFKAAIDQLMIEMQAAQKAPETVRQELIGTVTGKHAAPQNTSVSSPPTITTEDAYNALPPGAEYMKDGVLKRKK